MRTHQYAHKKRASQSSCTSVPRPSEVQSSVQHQPIQAKSNEEGLAEHAERLKKFQRLGNPFLDKGPPRFDNDMTSPLQPKPWIQRKLALGQPGDKYEQEADRFASQVVQQINAPISTDQTHRQSVQREKAQYGEMQANCIRAAIQRRQAIASGEASVDLESSINSARGRGQPLDAGLQQSMGQAMGADFSGVRVHTDSQSDQLNQSIQAKAFTTGQDVFFREGAYQPKNRRGQELIAHELTHVMQQIQGRQKIDLSIVQRELNKDDALKLTKYIKKRLGLIDKELSKEVKEQVAKLILNSKDLSTAKRNWERMEMFFKEFPKAKERKSDKSLEGWLEDCSFKDAVYPCVKMNVSKLAQPKDKQYILWSGGASDCVIVAAHSEHVSWIKHATALDIQGANPKHRGTACLSLDAEIKCAKPDKVYLVSESIETPAILLLIEALEKSGIKITRKINSHQLALNTKTGEISTDFKTEGLPK